MKNYDLFVFGNVSIAFIQTQKGEHVIPGGAISLSVWPAHQLGYSVGLLTKTSLKDKYHLQEFPLAEEDMFWRESKETTVTRSIFHTNTAERRVIINLREAEPYKKEDFPNISAKVVHHCSPIAGEIDSELIRFIANKFPIALDAQTLIRKVFPGGATRYIDWEDKRDILPLVRFFKVAAEEATVLTGLDTDTHKGRVSACEKILEWGAKETLLSHNEELIAVNESGAVFFPLKNKNDSGRTGRGISGFSTYITERLNKNPADALKFSAALTSMKLEVPGPFKQTRQDVEAFIRDFY